MCSSVSDKKYYRTGKNYTADDEILLICDSLRRLGEFAHIYLSAALCCKFLSESEIKEYYRNYQGYTCDKTCICKEIEE